MVAWFKRDIAAWMDGTEKLSHEAYRAYDVICNLIYLKGGPIELAPHGLAGRCNMSVRVASRVIEELIEAGKIVRESGKITNERAMIELGKVEKTRENKSNAGKASASSRNSTDKYLKNKEPQEQLLNDAPTDRLLDKTREEKKRTDSVAANAAAFALEFQEWYSTYPKRVGKDRAMKAYKSARKKTSKEVLLAGARAAVKEFSTREKQFIPHPATWLNDGRWDDEGQGGGELWDKGL